MPPVIRTTEAAESTSTSAGRSARLTWAPGESAMSLNEWPLPSTRSRPARATTACSWLIVAGRWNCGAVNVMLRAQFVRGTVISGSPRHSSRAGPRRGQRAAEPGLDDLPGDRHWRRQRDLAGLDRGEEFVAA